MVQAHRPQNRPPSCTEFPTLPRPASNSPCNQFLSQEPGTAVQACSLAASKFKVTFPMMGKIDVNGAEESEIYKFLKTEKPGVFNSTSIKVTQALLSLLVGNTPHLADLL